MKILIIDKNGVKEFAPLNLNSENQESSKSIIEILKKTFLPNSIPVQKPEINLFTISKLVELFNTTRPTIYSWIDNGDLIPIKIGGRVYFRQVDIQEMIARKSSESTI